MHLIDFRTACRMMWKNPGTSLLVVLALGLGIGASTTIYSIAHALWIKPLDWKAPDRLVAVSQTDPNNSPQEFTLPDFEDLDTENQVFEEMASVTKAQFEMVNGEGLELVEAARVSPNLFKMLGVRPVLGRYFLPDDATGQNDPVVLLSYQLWLRLGGVPAIVGSHLILNGAPYTVVGVMEPSGQVPSWSEMWIVQRPHVMEMGGMSMPDMSIEARRMHDLQVLARLKPGISIETSQANLDQIAHRLANRYPQTNAGEGILIRPLREELVGDLGSVLQLLLAAVAFVLVLGCANAANLLLGRTLARQREFAVRSAVGATRIRIAAQVFAEGLILAAVSGIVGLLFGILGLRVLTSRIPEELIRSVPGMNHLSISAPVLLFTLGTTIMCALLFAIVPAFFISSAAPNRLLKEEAHGSRAGQILRNVLLVSELSMAFVLLVGAGLLIRSTSNLRQARVGFNPKGVLVASVSLQQKQKALGHSFGVEYQQILEQIRTVPGVQSAAVITDAPLTRFGGTGGLWIHNKPLPKGSQPPSVQYRTVSPGYFETMQIPLFKGRDFTDQDTPATQNVVIINRAMANKFWHGEDPLGAEIKVGPSPEQSPWLVIVGIVNNSKEVRLDVPPVPVIYTNYLQDPAHAMDVVIRSRVSFNEITQGVRESAFRAGQRRPIMFMKSMDDIMADSIFSQRLSATLLSLFDIIAIVLAASGIYGVITYWISQRRHEIGIRMALGASRGRILRLVLLQAARLMTWGFSIGLVAILLLMRFISSMLFGIGPTDPTIIAMALLLLLLIALVASYVPARAAARLDPALILRPE